MFQLKLEIRNPFKAVVWKSFFVYTKTLTENKSFELQIMREDNLFLFDFDWRIKCDHDGPQLLLCFLTYQMDMRIYDNRHWNYDKGCRYEHGDPEDWANYKEEDEIIDEV